MLRRGWDPNKPKTLHEVQAMNVSEVDCSKSLKFKNSSKKFRKFLYIYKYFPA